jgi:RNA polymerase sigma-70 factor (ECF subfamily)
MVRAGDARTDGELVAAATSGDADAVAALLARYERPVLRFGTRFCRDTEASREVLQETLFSASRALPSYRGEASVGTWLYAIARRACLRLRARRARALADSIDEMLEREACAREEPDEGPCDLVDPAAPPDEAASEHELAAAFSRAANALLAPYREILLLRDVDGLTAPEAARALGISVDAAKSRLHRAREAVRARLAPLLADRAEEVRS